MTANPFKLVPPDPAPVDIAEQLRADIKKRDWDRVHIEGDRNPPIIIRLRRWFYSSPQKRGNGNG